MKFGKVEHPEALDLSLPPDHRETAWVLAKQPKKELSVYVGCAKWNRQDLKGFYPRGTKDELTYYASQFNAIELNATFYRLFPKEQFATWREKAPDGFKFFPKITQNISHLKRLLDPEPRIEEYLSHTLELKDKLGTIFLQMHNNFMPKNMDRVEHFLDVWPIEIPLAVEVRHTDWFTTEDVAARLYYVLEQKNVANVLVDTAGRRDIMHMRLTNDEAFIRFVGANHASDYDRLDEWVERLQVWRSQGLNNIHFFIHQNVEEESPLLSAYFIKKLNAALRTQLHVPQTLSDQSKLL